MRVFDGNNMTKICHLISIDRTHPDTCRSEAEIYPPLEDPDLSGTPDPCDHSLTNRFMGVN